MFLKVLAALFFIIFILAWANVIRIKWTTWHGEQGEYDKYQKQQNSLLVMFSALICFSCLLLYIVFWDVPIPVPPKTAFYEHYLRNLYYGLYLDTNYWYSDSHLDHQIKTIYGLIGRPGELPKRPLTPEEVELLRLWYNRLLRSGFDLSSEEMQPFLKHISSFIK